MATSKSTDNNSKGELLIYKGKDGNMKLDVRLQNETMWLSITQMAELFDVDKSGISRHLKNIFESGELKRDSVVAKFATTATDGKSYQVEYYNLDGIISTGYRVNSIRGTQFRIWATERLKDYIVKGFTIDDERLKEPEESDSGENLIFYDLDKKEILSKNEFVTSINSGGHLNYENRNIGGKETPVSKKDRFNFNNLG